MLPIKAIKKLKQIMKCNTGASLVFVLGIMLLLMAIGASVMTAASAGIGTNVRQNQYNEAVLLNDSVHRNILHSLQTVADPDDLSAFENSLASQLVKMIYENDVLPEEIELDLIIDDTVIGTGTQHKITLSFLFYEARQAGPSDFIPEIPIDRIAKTISINARMIVTVTTEINSGVSLRNENRVITTKATYQYSDGVLTDDPGGEFAQVPADEVPADLPMVFKPEDGYGTWSLLNYEIIETEVR